MKNDLKDLVIIILIVAAFFLIIGLVNMSIDNIQSKWNNENVVNITSEFVLIESHGTVFINGESGEFVELR